MFISDFAIKKPLITVVAMLTLAVFGLFALFKLKTDEFPDVAPPVVTIGIPYPGASPDGVEKEILDPIEEHISSISGVKHVNGAAYDGFGFIFVEFQFGKDLAEATQDLRDAISATRANLPAEMKEPIIKKFNDTDRPIISLALSSSTLSQAELTRLADPTITRELRSLAGVAEVAVSGKVERELTVELDPSRMQSAGVSVSQIVLSLQLQNLAAPVGRVTGSMDERSIRLKGRLENAQEFKQLIVAERNGIPTRLGDVADVRDGTEEPRTLALYNDKEAVGIDIKKAKGFSTTDVSDRIRARVELLQPTLGAGTKLELVRDSGKRVEHAVRNVEEALLEGALLTVLVVFLFLNSWRSTVITGLALPVSVLASFIAVWVMGFKLETMSLLGLSLAIGILIDDAIVVRENIVRHVEMGKDHYLASMEGTDEIGLAVAATTFSILAVFIPIGFMPGVGGQWFKPFALTIACSVAVSLFVSFSLDSVVARSPHLDDRARHRDIFRGVHIVLEGRHRARWCAHWYCRRRVASFASRKPASALGRYARSIVSHGRCSFQRHQGTFTRFRLRRAGNAGRVRRDRVCARPRCMAGPDVSARRESARVDILDRQRSSWGRGGRRSRVSRAARADGRRRVLPRGRQVAVHHRDRDPAGLQPAVHAAQGAGSRAGRPLASRGGLHLHHDRRRNIRRR